MLVLDPHSAYTRDDLLAHFSRRMLARLVADGKLLRLRRGAYASDAMPLELRRAIGMGAQLSCVSALSMQGFWRPPGCGLHVQVCPSASRLGVPRGSGAGVRAHWVPLSSSGPVAPVDDAVLRVIRCQPRRYAIAVVDSVLHAGRFSVRDLDTLMTQLPHASRIDLGQFDPRAESGVESLVRVALRDAGLTVQSQVSIPGVGRVDLLVEGTVIVEVDGREWHHDQQLRDYRRDLEAAARGFSVIRVDYPHATFHERIVVDAVRVAARSGSRSAGGVTQLRNFLR